MLKALCCCLFGIPEPEEEQYQSISSHRTHDQQPTRWSLVAGSRSTSTPSSQYNPYTTSIISNIHKPRDVPRVVRQTPNEPTPSRASSNFAPAPSYISSRPTASSYTSAAQAKPLANSSGLTHSHAPLPRLDLPTLAVSLVSHAHGRMRREERGIDKRELQEAVKYGRKERANPGRDGKMRWRYTHKGVVYITDDTSRHEITSWRLADALEGPPPALGAGDGAGELHVIAIVDASGSMRKDDVPGYESRTAAVYDCLARDLVHPQMRVEGKLMKVSLIEMRDDAKVLLDRVPPNQELVSYLKKRMTSHAHSNGNYLPALDAALKLAGNAGRQSQLFLLFLSDGAPSDHSYRTCSHGIAVWQPAVREGSGKTKGKQPPQGCPHSRACRGMVQAAVREECVQRVKRMGDLLGRDRLHIHTVAFGPPKENYIVLERMAEALPRHSFQKLGLSVACLRTALTSITSNLSDVRTMQLTLRSDISQKVERRMYDAYDTLTDQAGWNLYCGSRMISKKRHDRLLGELVTEPLTQLKEIAEMKQKHPNLSHGLAYAMYKFAEGAERVVFQCTEVVSFDGGKTGRCVGPRLVAKEARYEQHVRDITFHRSLCRIQGEAEGLAQLFNRRLAGGLDMQVHFLACFMYTIRDYRYSALGVLEILVEEELEGKFTKWNNNNGAVIEKDVCNVRKPHLGAIAEEDEEDEEDKGEDNLTACKGTAEHVPQCFSHFTYVATDGRKLVCDLQGVWNASDGFTLTDPVIHHRDGSKRNGATDKGMEGIRAFFATHVCNPLCKRLGLPSVPK